MSRVYVRTSNRVGDGYRDVEDGATYQCAKCGGSFPLLRAEPGASDVASEHAAVWSCEDGTDQRVCPKCDRAMWVSLLKSLSPGSQVALWLREEDGRMFVRNWSGSLEIELGSQDGTVERRFADGAPVAGVWAAVPKVSVGSLVLCRRIS